jgi:hypothetical protein
MRGALRRRSKRRPGNLSENGEQRWQHGNRFWLVSFSRALSIDRCAPEARCQNPPVYQQLAAAAAHQIVFFLCGDMLRAF